MTSPLSSQSASFSPAREMPSSPPTPSQEGRSLPAYHVVQQLPFELREHCIVYFEEGLYAQAFNLLTPLLSSSTSLSPAFLPPPQHLALTATLAVHPNFTNRAKSTSHIAAATLSLRYLRLVLKLVGPINARLHDAFTFTGISTSSRSARRRITDEVSSAYEDTDITSELATTSALWSQVENFWQVVGWAFNCSIAHPHRWQHWTLWLEYMVQVLEKDWETRWFETEAKEDLAPLQNSMIVRYLSSDTLGTGRERKVLRAVFADGSKNSMAEFREIWRNEAHERRKGEQGSKRAVDKKIDIEADDYGDYMASSSSSSDIEDPQPNAPTSPPLDESPDGTTSLGGPQALTLRLRLLSLVATVCVILPSSFIPLYDLYDLSLHFIRPLPLPTYFAFLSPLFLNHMTGPAAQTLLQRILRSLISSSAPLPSEESLNQEMLERCYLPWAANTQVVADNAKVSGCVEALIALYEQHCGLVWSEGLQEAAEKGIAEREWKAKKEGKGRKTRKGGGGGERIWLQGSAERVRAYVELAKMRQERDDQ